MQQENQVLVWGNTDVFLPLLDHQWLGNARELQNAIHRLVICTPEGTITQDIVSQIIQSIKKKQKTVQKLEVDFNRFQKMETDIWRKLLNEYDGNKERLCEVYNISKTTLWRKLQIDNNEQIVE